MIRGYSNLLISFGLLMWNGTVLFAEVGLGAVIYCFVVGQILATHLVSRRFRIGPSSLYL